jgi:hypothetical protein
MTLSPLILNLGTDNEIGFDLKIEGSDRDLGTIKPKIRFTLTEVDTSRGWIFGASKSIDKEDITILIPDMKNLVAEGKIYEGKLEVILGTRYFAPTQIEIKFIEPIKVEAAFTSTTEQGKNKEVIAENTKLHVKKIKEKLSYFSLSTDLKARVNRHFISECKRLGFNNPQKSLIEGTEDIKKKLRLLLVKSIIDTKKL